jgi:hypothetical protein
MSAAMGATMGPMLRHGIVLAGLAALGTMVGCGKKSPVPGATEFNKLWAELDKAGAEVSYIDDGRGEGLLASVQRAAPAKDEAAQVIPAPAPPRPPALPERLASDQVQRIIRGNLVGVRGCYMSMARAGQSRSGKAIVSFAIGADGKTTGLRVDAPAFADTSLPSCVSAQVSHWEFPKSQKGGGPLSYPFVFVGS